MSKITQQDSHTNAYPGSLANGPVISSERSGVFLHALASAAEKTVRNGQASVFPAFWSTVLSHWSMEFCLDIHVSDQQWIKQSRYDIQSSGVPSVEEVTMPR